MGSYPPGPPDLDELLARVRAGFDTGPTSPSRYPTELPERLRAPQAKAAEPERGIFDEALARVRGTFRVSMEEPDLLGRKYEPKPAEEAPDVGRVQQDFEDQVGAGAKQVREQGGDVEDYVYRQHVNRYGPTIAGALREGRRLASDQLGRGVSPEEADAAGNELAHRHLENIKNQVASGELEGEAADADRQYQGLIESLTTRKGLARQALSMGVPMAAGALASGPLGWGAIATAGALAATGTVGEAAAQKYVDQKGPVDWESATTAGLAQLAQVPGLHTVTSGAVSKIANPLLRRAAQTVTGAASAAVEMPLQTTGERLIRGEGLPSGGELAASAAQGAVVGSAIGGGLGLLGIEHARQQNADEVASETEISAPPPSRPIGHRAQESADAELQNIEQALAAARGAADLPGIVELEKARQAILDARAKGTEQVVPSEPPPPGEAAPSAPAPTTPPEGPGPAPAAPGAAEERPGPPPGPVSDVSRRPQTPQETAASEAGETTPVTDAQGRQAGTAPQVRALTEQAKGEAKGEEPSGAPTEIKGPTKGVARGVETTPEVPRPQPEAPSPAPVAPPPALPPTEAPPAPPVASRPVGGVPGPPPPAPIIPERRLRIGRGAHGQVAVVFPNQQHADLFSAIGRSRRQMRGEGGKPPAWDYLAAQFHVPPDLIAHLAQRYRDHIMDGIKALPEGETFVAPSVPEMLGREAAARPAPPPEVPEVEGGPEQLTPEEAAAVAPPAGPPSPEPIGGEPEPTPGAGPASAGEGRPEPTAAEGRGPAETRPEPAPEAAPPAPQAPPPTAPGKPTIAALRPEYRKPIEAAIKRLPPETHEAVRGHVEAQLERQRSVSRAESTHDYFGNKHDPVTGIKITNQPAKRAAAARELENARALYEAGWETIQGAGKDAAVTKRLRQVLEGKGIRGVLAPEPAPPLTRRVWEGVKGFVDMHPNAPTLDESIRAVKEYAKAYPRATEDVLDGMAALHGQIGSMSARALELEVDLPGLGPKKIAQALEAGPGDPTFDRIVAYRQDAEAEERALRELFAEHDDSRYEHPRLLQIADALDEDHDAGLDAGEDPLLKTFMWGVEDPKTGRQVELEPALAAIREGKGRLFARIQTAFNDAMAGIEHDVPFDIPEGGSDEGIQESKTVFVSSSSDPFDGRYGPPPKRLTPEQLEARKRWADRLLSGGQRGRTEIPAPRPAAAEQPGRPAAADVESAQPGGTGAAEPGGGAPGAGGRGRGLERGGGGEGDRGEPRAAAPAAGQQRRAGIFHILNPREAETYKHPPRYELIPSRLVQHLSEEQRVGVAKAIEAIDGGSGFLFQDGTGVGKTRELLATAYNYASKGWKVLIVSKASAIEATKDAKGRWNASGSFADDSTSMGVPIRFTKARGENLAPGTITLGTYHRLRDYVVDKSTLVMFDEAHQLKNMGDSEVAAEGSDLMKRARMVAFATATPGDKAYHLGYLAPIGLFEGKDPVQALKDLGLQEKVKRRVSQKVKKSLMAGGMSEAEATLKATEEFRVWKATSPSKHRKALEALFNRLTERGTVIKREVDLSPVEVQTVLVPLPDEGKKAMQVIEEGKFDKKGKLMHMRRQQEPYKLDRVKEIVRNELAEGRQVVVFATRLHESEVIERGTLPGGERYERSLMKSEGTLKTLGDWLDNEGIPYAEIHGEAKESSKDAQGRFQSGNAKVVIATYEKGGTGINLDDRSGAAPRTMVLMTAPFGATDIVQAIGRVHRITTRTPSRVKVLYSDHGVDLWNAAVIGGKLKQHHAQVSGDIAALDLANTSADEEALNAGSAHYMDVAQALGGNAAPGAQPTTLYSPRHFSKVVQMLKKIGVKMTLKGGDFEIPTHEGFTITGRLEKTPSGKGYGELSWEHDDEAGDLRLAAAMAPPSAKPAENAKSVEKIVGTLRELSGFHVGKTKPIVSMRQYEFLQRRLNELGASWGVRELPGAFQIISKDGQFYTGELVPPKREVFGRAPNGEEGAFHWNSLERQAEGTKFEPEEGELTALDHFAQGKDESLDPAFEVVGASGRGGDAVPRFVRPDLPWGTPQRLGTGHEFRENQGYGVEGVKTLATVLKEGFTSLGRIDWRGWTVRTIDDFGALFHAARNPSLEHGALGFVDGETGKMLAMIQVTSQSPIFVSWGERQTYMHQIVDTFYNLQREGVNLDKLKVVDVHNHPSGHADPSKADMQHAAFLAEFLPSHFLGSAVIDHERVSIITPTGGRYDITKGEGFVDPDPYFQEGVDAADFYDPAKPGMVGSGDLRSFAQGLVRDGMWKEGSTDVQVAFLDAQAQLRTLALIPESVFTNPELWKRFVERAGRMSGAAAVYAATDGGFVRSEAVVRAATMYHMNGTLQEMVDLRGDITPRQALMRTGVRAPSTYDWGRDSAQAGTNLSSRLEDTTRQTEPPPSAYPPWNEKAPDWWERRVQYARARMEALGRGAQMNVGVDPTTFWDGFVLGADAVRRGARKFGDWMKALGDLPHISTWAPRVWNYLKSLGAPVVVERAGNVRPFGEAAAGVMAQMPGEGPREIRPIPSPTTKDLATAVEALLRGESGEPVDYGAGKPLGVGVPKDLAINIHQIVDEAGIREATARIIRALEPRFDLARKKFTAAELTDLALGLGYDHTDIARMLRVKGALNAKEIIAGRVLRQTAGVEFTNKWASYVDALERSKAPDLSPQEREQRNLDLLEAEREQLAALHKYTGIMFSTAAAGSEAGRALWAHKLMVSSLTPEERLMQRLLRQGRIDQQQLGALAAAFAKGDQQAVARIIRRAFKPGFMKMAVEYFINSLLSGPPTFVANVSGNLVHEAALRTPERGIAARLEDFGIRQGIERLLTGKASPRERVVGQAMEALRAQMQHKFGILASLDMARQSITREDAAFMQSIKGDIHVPAIPGTFGKVVRTPGRIMEALDIGAKISAAAAEKSARLWFKAYEDAHAQGHEVGSPEFKEHLRDLHDLMNEWIALETQRRRDPKLFQQEHGAEGYKFLYRHRDLAEVHKQMEHAADVSTFRDQVTRFSGFVKQMRNAYPALSFIVPFIHTSERILVQGFRRTPMGLLKSLYNIQQGKLSGGEASDRLAQGMLGTMLTGAIYMLAKDGQITGAGPDEPRERENWLKTGKLPYAVKIGGKWISYGRLEPFATIFGFASDLAEATNEKDAGDAFGKLHYAMIKHVTNATFLEGVVSAAEAIGDPDRNMARYWKRSLGAVVPNLLASGARALDPTIRETDDLSQVLMSRVPILSEQLPARLTGTGEPVQRPETGVSRFVSPFRYNDDAGPEKNLERMFLETGYSPSQPPKEIALPGSMGRHVKLTRGERELYANASERATNFARTLTANKDWSRLDVFGKEEMLKRIYRTVHDVAQRDILASVMNRLRQGQGQIEAHK